MGNKSRSRREELVRQMEGIAAKKEVLEPPWKADLRRALAARQKPAVSRLAALAQYIAGGFAGAGLSIFLLWLM